MKKLILTAGAILLASFVSAQPIPADTALRTGKLDNGMTYYVRSNAKPENQADFYIFHNVGAIQEEDSQQGLAHFLEHMAFNGTKNFPGKNLMNYLETIGVKFGANLNAYTSMEETCYNISSVPLLREGIIDSCLLILHDWSYYISLEDEEIDNERGVIIEELRTRNTAGWRLNEKVAPTMYNHSKYADRNIIGSIEGLKSFPYQEIKDFYHRWYRTDQQAIVVVGDFDADMMVEKIKKVMADIPAVENPVPKEVIKIEGNTEPLVCVATDPEQTSTMIRYMIKNEPIPFEMNNSIQAYVLDIARDMICDMLYNRLDDIAQQPNSPIVASASMYGGLTTTSDVFLGVAIAHEGEAARAFETLCTEIEKAYRFGFTQSELERVQADWMRSSETAYNKRADRRNEQFVNEYISAYRENIAVPSAEDEWEIRQQIIPNLTIEQLNQIAKELVFKHEDNVVIIYAPEKEGANTPSNEDILAIIEKVRSEELEPYAEDVVKEPLIPEGTVLKGSPVAKTSTDKLGATVWTLKNGIKVVALPTDYMTDEIRVSATALGGNSLVDEADDMTASVLTGVVEQSGIGKFSLSELKKQLSGKLANFSLGTGAYTANGRGNCSTKDLETEMQLIYLYFTSPRWNIDDFNVYMGNQRSMLQNIESNPMFKFQQEIYKSLYNNHPRRGVMSLKDLDKIDFEKMPELYNKMFGNAADFTFFFVGDFQLDTLKPLVEKYIGSLPTSKKTHTWVDDNARLYKGDVENVFEAEMSMPKTSIFLAYTGPSNFKSLEDHLAADFLSQIMRQRYTISIREEQGGTYGVSTYMSVDTDPKEDTYMLQISFDTNKEMSEKLIGITKDELRKMAESGPTEEEMGKVKEYMIKQHKDNLKKNASWLSDLIYLHIYDFDAATDYERVLNEMSAEKVQKLMAKVLDDSNELTVIMNPAESAAEEAAE